MCSRRGLRLVRRLRPRVEDDEEEPWRLSRVSTTGSATAAALALPPRLPLESAPAASAGSSPFRLDACSPPEPEPEPRLRDRRLRVRVRAVPVPPPGWAWSPSPPPSAELAGSPAESSDGVEGASASAGADPSAAAVPPPPERLRRRRGRPSRGVSVPESPAASVEVAFTAGASASAAGLDSAGEPASAAASPALRRGARERRSANGTLGAPSAAWVLSAGGALSVPAAGVTAPSDAAPESGSDVTLGLRVRARGALLGLASALSPAVASGDAGAVSNGAASI